jgi:calcium-dependent protein kinase
LLGRRYGPPADMFSVGATLFTMVTGNPPQWLDATQRYTFPGFPTSDKWTRLSPEAQGLIGQLVTPDPKKRPTAVEALQDPWLLQTEVGTVGAQNTVLMQNLRKFGHRTKLQQCARASVAALANLDAPERGPEVRALLAAFVGADRSGDGEINSADLAASLQMECGIEAAALLDSLDTSQNGTISWTEWVAAASSSSWFGSEDEAWHAFKTLDADGDGHITPRDLQEVLPQVFCSQERRSADSMSAEDLTEDLQHYNRSGDGRIDFPEFCHLLRDSMSAFKVSTARPKRKDRPRPPPEPSE